MPIRAGPRRGRWSAVSLIALFALPAMMIGGNALEFTSPTRAQEDEPSILVYSRTTGFRHGSIPDGIAAIEAIGAEEGFSVTASEDPMRFTDEGLAPFDVVVFLNTTGDILDDAQQAAFERYLQAGGGFVGVHSATDTEYDWPWYGDLVGAYFARHPRVQEADIDVVDPDHASTRHLPTLWTRRDEWYDFRSDPRERVNVLLNLDESSYEGGQMGLSHPIAWYHEYDGGRGWYTAMGHTSGTYSEPLFRQHLAGGIAWAAGWESARPTEAPTLQPRPTAAPIPSPWPSATPRPSAIPPWIHLPWLSRS